eukprot:2447280-Prorocentrum_lima.AAC.1
MRRRIPSPSSMLPPSALTVTATSGTGLVLRGTSFQAVSPVFSPGPSLLPSPLILLVSSSFRVLSA